MQKWAGGLDGERERNRMRKKRRRWSSRDSQSRRREGCREMD